MRHWRPPRRRGRSSCKLHQDLARALHSPELAERLAGLGLEPFANPPDQTAVYIQSEIAKWRRWSKAAGIRAD
jgi:tripartite-type tricarboxylate transporter receptor subunit TctC